LIQTVHLIQLLHPLTTHQTTKIQLYPSKYFSSRVKTSGPFQKIFKFLSLSLSLPNSLSQICPKPLSLSHPPTTLVRRQNTPSLLWRTAPPLRKAPSFRYSLVLSLSLAASLFLSPHLSHLTGYCSTPAKSRPLAGAEETSSLRCCRFVWHWLYYQILKKLNSLLKNLLIFLDSVGMGSILCDLSIIFPSYNL
jgi:hypothetical protein